MYIHVLQVDCLYMLDNYCIIVAKVTMEFTHRAASM